MPCKEVIWPKTQAEYDAMLERWYTHPHDSCEWVMTAERAVMQWMPPEFWAASRAISTPKTDAEMRATQLAYEAHAETEHGGSQAKCPICHRYEDVRDAYLFGGFFTAPEHRVATNPEDHLRFLAIARAGFQRLRDIMAAPRSN